MVWSMPMPNAIAEPISRSVLSKPLENSDESVTIVLAYIGIFSHPAEDH